VADEGDGRAGSLVGRDPELAMIHAFLLEARSRGGALVLVGDAGVGKTALLDAAVADAAAAGVRAAGGGRRVRERDQLRRTSSCVVLRDRPCC